MVYELWYQLDQKKACLIAISDDQDGLITDQGMIPSFTSSAGLRAHARASDLQLWKFEAGTPESVLVDLDLLQGWLQDFDSQAVDCKTLLEAWNLFWDLSLSLEIQFDTDHTKTNAVYEKLFWGCNLPSVIPPGKTYTPLWSRNEREVLQSVLSQGLQAFRSRVTAR